MIKKIKKLNFSETLSNEKGFPLSVSKKIINNLIFSLIKNIKDQKLILKNIGTLKVINKKERVGRNPKTGQNFIISRRKSISFTPSKNLKKIIND